MGVFDKFKSVIGLTKENNPPAKQVNNRFANVDNVNQKNIDSNQNKDSPKNFKYLDKLIHGSSNEINLDTNIIIQEEMELPEYSEGISITDGNLVIDGKNHFIDAKSKVPILKINGGKITFKNITFKNGFHEHSRNYTEESNLAGVVSNGGAELLFENCHFINNQSKGYSSSAGAILNSEGLITFKKCNFKDNYAEEGGAIYNIRGSLNIYNSNFENNSAIEGGAIYIASGTINASDCIFSNNTSKHIRKSSNDVGGGGAIASYNKFNFLSNEKSHSTFNNCIFESNSAKEFGGAILNGKECSLECIDCTFKDNFASTGSAIRNREKLSLKNTNFINNKSDFAATIMQEDEDSNTSILNCSFESNFADYGIIFIHYGSLHIKNSKFINNSHNDGYEIYNDNGFVFIEKPKISQPNQKIIYNNNILKIRKEDDLENRIIESSTSVINYSTQSVKDSTLNFTHLDNIIQKSSNELLLKDNILMDSSEQNFYEGGIELDKDDFTIDGQGHIINANELSRIFYVTGKNITLKNIIFKNGKYFKNILDDENFGGGAILTLHNTSLNIINCEFINNNSRTSGGAIYSKDELKIIKNSKFLNNLSQDNGGAINSPIELNISDSHFENNVSKNGHGGAIHSTNNLNINNSIFNNNNSQFGGAINLEEGNLSLNDCSFINNHAEMIGGSIHNTRGSLISYNCNFNENTAYSAPAIDSSGCLKLNKCNFTQNRAENECGAINTSGSGEFTKCIFKYNDLTIDNLIVKNDGCGSICNSGSLIIDSCEFTGQREEIIQNLKELTIQSCDFGFNHFINNKGIVYLDDMVLKNPIIK